MSQSKKPVSLALGAAVATGTLIAGSLFSMNAMAHGYMTETASKATTAEGKCGEGKCGEGKCGGEKAGRDAAMGMASGKRPHKPHTMASMDTDKDGRMSRAEFAAAHEGSDKKFATYDVDGDGFITQVEMDARHAEMKSSKPAEKAKMEGKCGEGKCGGKS